MSRFGKQCTAMLLAVFMIVGMLPSTVLAAEETTNYKLVTDASALAAGDKVIIVSKKSDGTTFLVLVQPQPEQQSTEIRLIWLRLLAT